MRLSSVLSASHTHTHPHTRGDLLSLPPALLSSEVSSPNGRGNEPARACHLREAFQYSGLEMPEAE